MIGIAPAPAPATELTETPTPRRPLLPGLLVATLAAITACSMVLLFFGAFAYGLSGLQEQRSQHQLYASLRGLLDPSSEIAPSIGGAIVPGTPVALLNSPDAGMQNVVVIQGTSAGDLLEGPGHLANSPLPGQVGDSVLVGRSTTAGAPFGGITGLDKGAVIAVTTGQGTFHFIVEDQRVAGDAGPTIPAGGSLLTLVTSAGSGWLGRLAPNHLVYVDAILKGKAVPAPPGQPVAVSAASYQGHNDPGAWPFVVLWLLALLVAAAAVAWLWRRWGHRQTWLVGAPVVLGILWAFSTEAMRLLPNVF
jgi:sortase A